MGNSTTTTLTETMSSRKQPLRQTRTNTARNAAASRTLDTPAEKPKAAPGFFPGITRFTDAITALPREMIRHSTMLKEVDAKIHGPEVALNELLATIPPIDVSQNDPADRARRGHFFAARIKMNEMLGSLDEKNHVLSTANETIEKLLARCESAWPLVEQEISEEARWGRLDHWAYTDRSVEKKPTANPERSTRRADLASANAAAAATAADVEAAASRSDTRGKAHRKVAQALAGHDSDLDGHKKTGASHKRKPQDITSAPSGAGLGITHGSAQSNKRRKVEKPLPLAAISGVAMEKSLSAVFGSGRNGPGSPRESSIADTGRKKGKAAGAASNGRKRAGTVNSNVGSPMIASSPIVGTFAAPGKAANSPAMGAPMARSTSTRARQNSSQTVSQVNRPQSATSNPQANGGAQVLAELDRATRSNNDPKNIKGEDNNADTETRTSSRTNDRSMKREESSTGRPRPPSISTSTRNNGKASKTGTPIVSSFSDTSRPRSGRNSTTTLNAADLPVKRSHKKKEPAPQRQRSGNGKSAKAKEEDDGSLQDDDDEEEPRYCYCNGISYGEMVACDMDGCKKEWFHLDCVGLSRPPTAKSKWYCDDCKPKLEQKQAVEVR